MSFSKTVDQIRNRSKTVTRRPAYTWENLRNGDLLRAVLKAQGLKKGEHVEDLAVIEVVMVNHEQLCIIGKSEVTREGFPEIEPLEFVQMFCRMHRNGFPRMFVKRIEFKYVD